MSLNGCEESGILLSFPLATDVRPRPKDRIWIPCLSTYAILRGKSDERNERPWMAYGYDYIIYTSFGTAGETGKQEL